MGGRARALAGLAAAFWLLAAAAPAAAQSLAVSNLASTSATVTISGHSGNWWYNISGGTSISCTNDGISGSSVNLTGLTPSSNHIFTAWSSCSGPPSIRWLAEVGFTTQAAAPTLNFTPGIEANADTGVLRLTGHSGNWYYKYTKPAGGACSAAVTAEATSITGLALGTTYTFKAYSDSGCQTVIATAADKTTAPPKVTGVTVAGRHKSLAVSWTAAKGATGYQVEWKSGQQSWSAPQKVTGTSHTITGLTNATTYTVRVIARNKVGLGNGYSDSKTGTPVAATLAASGATHNSATLTIGNYTGNWHYKANAAPDASCSTSAVTAATKSLTGLSGNTSYTYKAYSDSSCSTLLATAAAFLTRPGKPSKPTATAGAGSGKLTLSASVTGSGTLTKWQYQRKAASDNSFGSWQNVSSTSTSLSHVVTGLTDGTDYQFKVRAVNAAGNSAASDASDATQPLDEALKAGGVTHNSATLVLENHPGAWQYKESSFASLCTPVAQGTTTVNLANLSPARQYTYTAYDGGCSAGNRLAATTFLTKPGQVSGVTAAGLHKSLSVSWTAYAGTVAGYKVQWKSGNDQYNTGNRQMTVTPGSATAASITGLANATEYTVRVTAYNATGDGAASAERTATPTAATLTASDVEDDTATLTIANHTAAWWHKGSQDGAACTEVAAGTATAGLTGLATATSHTYTAYNDANCSTVVATAAAFLTTPGEVSGVALTALSARIDVSWTAHAGTVTGYKVQWKSGGDDYNTDDRQMDVTPGDSTTASITGLTNGTVYTVRVTAYNATGDGTASAESAATPAAVALPGTSPGTAVPPGAGQAGGDGGRPAGHAGLDLERRRRRGDHQVAVRQEGGRQRLGGLLDGRSGQRREHHQPHGHRPEARHRLPVQGAGAQCRWRGRGVTGIG